MSTKEMFSKERVTFNLKAKTKEEAIDELIDILYNDGKVTSKEELREAVLKREEEFSTGIGMGIAIPHGKCSAVKEAAITFGLSKEGIDYQSMDDQPAHMFFLIAVPKESNDVHLRALSEISRKLMHADVREKIKNAQSFEEFIEVFE
ncbi:PTS sugar transporter subunit IIA [Clostridium felsineum]|uniref:PTS system fructose-specific EIIABC component n=1 Tax=Clostridium felsineum TaxID=36839 RepID=A0A1S8LSB7_9CLOT|nr:PTS sugar transporter subunit IIA [Clostridium felsineum]MCR3761465.1 PTS sugar transporter subunit IIA [Clostridium felsineum]URZ02494.1 PTS system fructose-specific EIIABC component [Clostridium felsineum]URZ04770.1 PTS system fructose-specific EIIABC component [Clostridium felsineum]URZ09811.1 PTS system fructose-specific EIIABC component [Clostridium felsineum]URZ18281.1 PTS system fructose-specific EIIABC component [Clostridium felsineum DSM 794]